MLIDQQIADRIYERLKRHMKPRHYSAIRRRVQELLKEYRAACVLAVAWAGVDEAKGEWSLGKLSDAAFAYQHDRLNVPEGAWFHYLWLQEEIDRNDPERKPIRYGLVYWLDLLSDSITSGDPAGALEARHGLQTLKDNYYSTPPEPEAAETPLTKVRCKPFHHIHDGYPEHSVHVKAHERFFKSDN